jgi:chaperonin GroEL (HSP60 family)
VIRRAKPEPVIERIATATGATVINDTREIESHHLGRAGIVKEINFHDLEFTLVGDCPDTNAVSIVTQAGTWLASEEIARSLESVFQTMETAMHETAVVPGGGCLESRLGTHLRESSRATKAREAPAIEAVGEAFDAVVRVLARNSGLDPINIETTLRSQNPDVPMGIVVTHEQAAAGNVLEKGIVDPVAVKRNSISAALDAAKQAITIDQLFTRS